RPSTANTRQVPIRGGSGSKPRSNSLRIFHSGHLSRWAVWPRVSSPAAAVATPPPPNRHSSDSLHPAIIRAGKSNRGGGRLLRLGSRGGLGRCRLHLAQIGATETKRPQGTLQEPLQAHRGRYSVRQGLHLESKAWVGWLHGQPRLGRTLLRQVPHE